MKTLIPSLVLVVALLSAVPARSADAEKTPQEIENLAKELVLKLGDPSYREREAANRDLVKLGPGALKAIDDGRKSSDTEIRTRCERLYPRVRRLDLERRIEELAGNKEGRIANTLPLGTTYETICGKDANARKYFIELCKNNLQMLDDAANNPKTTGEAYFYLAKKIENRGNGGAALLLIGADEKIAPSIEEANRKQPTSGNYLSLAGILCTPKNEAALIDANNGRYFRKLLFAWTKRHPEALAVQPFVKFIQDMLIRSPKQLQGDPDTLEFLLDFAVLISGVESWIEKSTAMQMVLASSLSKNDKYTFFEEKLFKDKSALRFGVLCDVKGSTIQVDTLTCDYALAICVKLSGQSYQDYGFDILGTRSDMPNSWAYSGFKNDRNRKAAFKKYEEWRKANPISKAAFKGGLPVTGG
jgi:hypothetical protein